MTHIKDFLVKEEHKILNKHKDLTLSLLPKMILEEILFMNREQDKIHLDKAHHLVMSILIKC